VTATTAPAAMPTACKARNASSISMLPDQKQPSEATM